MIKKFGCIPTRKSVFGTLVQRQGQDMVVIREMVRIEGISICLTAIESYRERLAQAQTKGIVQQLKCRDRGRMSSGAQSF